MSRPLKNVDQIRSLLRQMDRSIEDARGRREGTPRPATSSLGQTPPSAEPPTVARSHPFPTSSSTSAHSAPRAAPNPAPAARTNPMHATNGNGNGSASPQPQRLKAKPKRPGSDDPLQDFQQRQAS